MHTYIHVHTHMYIHVQEHLTYIFSLIAICILVYPGLIKTLEQLAYRWEETGCRPANCIHDTFSLVLVGNT